MALTNKDSIRFAPEGQIYIASLSKNPKFPLTPVEKLGAEWLSLGYVDGDGVEVTPSVETQGQEAWQSATPVLYTVTSAALQIKAILLQTDPVTTSLYFGADWVPVTDATGQAVPNSWRLTIESNPDLAECAMIIEWSDNRIHSRLVIPRGMTSGRDALKLTRKEAQSLGITFDALDSSGQLGYILTDDPAMGVVAPVAPTVKATPTSTTAGTSVTLSGLNWSGAAPTVTVLGAQASKFTASNVALTSGSLSGTLAVAAGTPAGEYTVQAASAAGTATTALTITA